ncbi:transmembrane protein, putative (macronuclear) [Tetrahymena thermophila SB210]|uniref:Transmembrane protein, putative n=1 Tax=Tetrahymena thermophila (strain SB210) TaxID=312017 RepID=W7XLM2_TETTS|nr:transmembrane protein, putative [Tetrahymena thermophila SB210]EWS76534.1 transmembrane protein, putative [Tetrahymena thermophila SB210]|eukprot:XP_012650906.1 transmembrane protein, putative [Tetrahymena thermophila SB210]
MKIIILITLAKLHFHHKIGLLICQDDFFVTIFIFFYIFFHQIEAFIDIYQKIRLAELLKHFIFFFQRFDAILILFVRICQEFKGNSTILFSVLSSQDDSVSAIAQILKI